MSKIKTKQINNFTSDVRSQFTPGAGISINSGAIASTITQYTDVLAKTAAVVNSMAGSQQDQAASVSSVKAYYTGGTGISVVNGVIASTASGGSGSVPAFVTVAPVANDYTNNNSIIWVINGNISLPDPVIASPGQMLYIKNSTQNNIVITTSTYMLEAPSGTFNLNGYYSALTLVKYNNKWMVL